MNEYAVGVDSGGSTTEVALARLVDGELSVVAAGPANATTTDPRTVAVVIAEAIRAALPADAVPVRCYVGAAGAGAAGVRLQIAQALRERFPSIAPRLRVGDDLQIALRAVIEDGPGVALVAGTGSAAYGENGALTVRVGGAGYLLGDEGSGFAIGFSALKLAARAYEGRAPYDETVRLVERTLDVHDRDSLLARVYGEARVDVPRVAALAPIVIAFAGKGNRASRAIVEAASQELCALARAAIERCAFAESPVRVGLCGGLFREPNAMRTLVSECLYAEVAGVSIAYESGEAGTHARAALRLARALQESET